MTESTALPPSGYVRQAQLIPDVIPFSATTLWRKVREHEFPQVKLSARVTAWKVEEVRAWLGGRTSWPSASVASPIAIAEEMPVGDDEFIQKLAAAVGARMQLAPAPVQIDLWDVATIARVMKLSKRQVRTCLTSLPDFPKAIRLPAEGGRVKLRYRSDEVTEWALTYQDKT